jgi:hypothetical protein
MQLRDARIERWGCRTRLDTPIINQMGAIMLTSVNAIHRYFIRASLSRSCPVAWCSWRRVNNGRNV